MALFKDAKGVIVGIAAVELDGDGMVVMLTPDTARRAESVRVLDEHGVVLAEAPVRRKVLPWTRN